MKLEKYIPQWSYRQQFITKLKTVADYLGTNADYIIALILHESNFNLKAINPKTNAVGLIQWMPSTLAGWNIHPADVLQMNGLQQLDLIKRFFAPYRKYGLNKPLRLHLTAFYPYALHRYNEGISPLLFY